MYRYDHTGNRLTKTRDGGTNTYQYLTNGSGGNTPILDQVALGVGGTRGYTWGAAGHLEEVAAGANVLDFGADAEGRLSGVDRTAAEAAGFAYDGRSFLRSAQETAGGTSSVEPLYDSAGLIHALRRRPAPADPEELVVFVYLAGRPVAQLAIDGLGEETWTYLSTDHLGTRPLSGSRTGSSTATSRSPRWRQAGRLRSRRVGLLAVAGVRVERTEREAPKQEPRTYTYSVCRRLHPSPLLFVWRRRPAIEKG